MRFKQFIESMGLNHVDPAELPEPPDYKSKIEQIINDEWEFDIAKIKANCGPYIEALKSGKAELLYRGIKAPLGGTFKRHDMPVDRQAKDSDRAFTFLFNMAFEETYGFSDIRSHTVFCSPDPTIAREYGDIYITIPAGEFLVAAHRIIKDSWGSGDTIHEIIAEELAERAQEADENVTASKTTLEGPLRSAARACSTFDDYLSNVLDVCDRFNITLPMEEVEKAVRFGFKVFGQEYKIGHNALPGDGKWKTEYLLYQADAYYTISADHIIEVLNNYDHHFERAFVVSDFWNNKTDLLRAFEDLLIRPA